MNQFDKNNVVTKLETCNVGELRQKNLALMYMFETDKERLKVRWSMLEIEPGTLIRKFAFMMYVCLWHFGKKKLVERQ